jgi:peptide deformylase
MSVLEIRKFPEKVLKEQTVEVEKEEFLDPSFQKLVDDMIETAISVDAMGLAAPQIGISKKLFIVRKDKTTKEFEVFVNPVIVIQKDKVTHHGEGCLSVPGQSFGVKRCKSVTLDAYDRNGKPRLAKSRTKIQAFAFQHEMDHLNGILVYEKGVPE